jgi:hypothetical protein
MQRGGVFVASLLAAFAVVGSPATPARAGDGADAALLCRAQADDVERAEHLPPGLLLAVGRVESGRSASSGHDVLPWPWTVNDEGEEHVFGSAFDAIAYVVAARGRGSRSLDVGCFQVNLQFHPDAFATIADAFDPARNARYAGFLLADLHKQSGSWQTAVQLYHSATPWRGEAYRDRVLAHWAETSLTTGASPATLPHPLPVPQSLVSHLAASASGRDGGFGIRIQYPSASLAAAPAAAARGRLPLVIVPGNAARPARPPQNEPG